MPRGYWVVLVVALALSNVYSLRQNLYDHVVFQTVLFAAPVVVLLLADTVVGRRGARTWSSILRWVAGGSTVLLCLVLIAAGSDPFANGAAWALAAALLLASITLATIAIGATGRVEDG